jgi:hypothetical protein
MLSLQTLSYAADARSYIIIDDEQRASDVYICDYYYIFVPDNLDTKKQLITKDMLKEEFEKIPLKLRSGIQSLVLLDYKSAWETKFQEMYNKNICIFSEYYQDNIFFYQNDCFEETIITYIDENGICNMDIMVLDDYLKKYLYHESGHHYDSINKISEYGEWRDIVDKDKVNLYTNFYSNYAEEFATSVEKYYLDLDYLKKYCPERYDFISKIFEQKK